MVIGVITFVFSAIGVKTGSRLAEKYKSKAEVIGEIILIAMGWCTKMEVMDVADSNITKRALAAALKELMEEKAFDKISVGDICEKCDMNRKSFYYHFRDKYDLVNWIFDTEFIAAAHTKNYEDAWLLLADICQFFYVNRSFYRKAFFI